MSEFHLTHPRLDGPAERVLVQPWLTDISHASLNAYAETSEPSPAPTLAVVETLPERAPLPVGDHLPIAA